LWDELCAVAERAGRGVKKDVAWPNKSWIQRNIAPALSRYAKTKEGKDVAGAEDAMFRRTHRVGIAIRLVFGAQPEDSRSDAMKEDDWAN